MKKIILILVWLTVLLTGISVFSFVMYPIQRDNHVKAMGQACLHHVHNMEASADANLKDIYTVGVSNKQIDYVVWQATMDCLQRYPLYSGQENFSGFNTTLN